jgi:hypothetical protein
MSLWGWLRPLSAGVFQSPHLDLHLQRKSLHGFKDTMENMQSRLPSSVKSMRVPGRLQQLPLHFQK